MCHREHRGQFFTPLGPSINDVEGGIPKDKLLYKKELSLKVFFFVMSLHQKESFESRPLRKQYFSILIHIYTLTWWEKVTFEFGSSLHQCKKRGSKIADFQTMSYMDGPMLGSATAVASLIPCEKIAIFWWYQASTNVI